MPNVHVPFLVRVPAIIADITAQFGHVNTIGANGPSHAELRWRSDQIWRGRTCMGCGRPQCSSELIALLIGSARHRALGVDGGRGWEARTPMHNDGMRAYVGG
jgi:hypothetical protein